MTHCDKKPRGKVGGSAISVYQALLHPHTESLGTRLGGKAHPPNFRLALLTPPPPLRVSNAGVCVL